MNKQTKRKGGLVVSRGIGWCDWTFNPVAGCRHGCRWQMPDGSIAVCYAKTVSERLASAAYPAGFDHHYWRPDELEAPLRVPKPARIFVVSMGDLLGAWVPDWQINDVLDVCRQAHWHTFQILTKNAPRLLKFEFPPNCWLGFSTPPDHMNGKRLSPPQRDAMLRVALEVMEKVDAAVRWSSIEPLSWNVAPIFAEFAPLEWAVVGAASDGPRYYQPAPSHVVALHELFGRTGVRMYHKENLAWLPRRKEFPKEFLNEKDGQHGKRSDY